MTGSPVSAQSNNRSLLRRWREQVREAATTAWPSGAAPVTVDCLLIAVYYYSRAPVLLDNDNFVKPIQDALSGLVYANDRQVTDTIIRRTDINGMFFIQGQSEILLAAIWQGNEFVYVRVGPAPDHRRML